MRYVFKKIMSNRGKKKTLYHKPQKPKIETLLQLSAIFQVTQNILLIKLYNIKLGTVERVSPDTVLINDMK